MFDLRRLRPLAAAAGLGALAVGIACQDQSTEPSVRPPLMHAPVSAHMDALPGSSPDNFTGESGATNSYYGGQDKTIDFATVPVKAWYKIEAVGVVTATPNPIYNTDPPKDFGPAGYARAMWGDGNQSGFTTVQNVTSDSSGSGYGQIIDLTPAN